MVKKVVKIEKDPEACGCCRFFLANEHDSGGYCRRYPPVPIADEDGLASVGAMTDAFEWCGEFSRKLNS